MTRMRGLAAGSKLGKYEIQGRLAVGGMAEIYLARATGLEGFEKPVVLKRLAPEHAEDPDFVRMFLDEARLAALLQHHNVAQVYDVGLSDGCLFMAMEYVHGESAQKILAASRYARRELPLAQCVAIGIGVSAGLHYAHEKHDLHGQPLGIVHRDVSPSNVLVTYDGGVKLVDFGVAKALHRDRKTRVGVLKGKLSYMSPEQCRGEETDRRSDVFSMGVLLYELTTGSKPFQGPSEYAVLNRIIGQEPAPPKALKPDYPPGLETILLRALRKDRAERYASARELQIDLEEFARSERLATTQLALAAYIEQIFGRKRDAWSDLCSPSSATEVSISLIVDAEGGGPVSRRRARRGWRLRSIAAVLALLGAMLAVAVVIAQTRGKGTRGTAVTTTAPGVAGLAPGPASPGSPTPPASPAAAPPSKTAAKQGKPPAGKSATPKSPKATASKRPAAAAPTRGTVRGKKAVKRPQTQERPSSRRDRGHF